MSSCLIRVKIKRKVYDKKVNKNADSYDVLLGPQRGIITPPFLRRYDGDNGRLRHRIFATSLLRVQVEGSKER